MPLALLTRKAPRPPLRQSVALPPIQETDLDRVLKLVPTEILTLYTAAVPVTSGTTWRGLPLVLFVVGLGLVPLVLHLDGRTTHQPAAWPQYVFRCLVFVAWANAISSPLAPWTDGQELRWLRSLAVLGVPLLGGLVLRE